MNPISEFWNGLDRRGRWGFGLGLAGIVAVVAIVAALTLRTTWGTLFSGLNEADMATITGELDKMKMPYRVSDDGARLLVPEPAVHKTRLALMGRELPLHGAVGFELFNNVEFGTSDFVQKVNYQRALQGELTRTILAFDEVQAARVHLALPEQTLFRKDGEKAKASVTVVTKPGRTLEPAQVQGIQRLVAASVQQVQAQDVTVLDQRGVPLSRAAAAADGEAAAATGLDAKADAEKYLTRKAAEVLDRTLGTGVAVVSVDAVFAQEQTRVTTEEVLPARSADPSQVPAGVVVKERQSSRGAEGGTGPNAPETTSSETEYQVGRRTEQVTSPAGALKRLHVAVVVRRAMTDAELQRVREIVSATIGINRERGDVVAVEAVEPPVAAASAPGGPAADAGPLTTAASAPASASGRAIDDRAVGMLAGAAIAACLALAGLAAWLGGRRRGARAHALTEQERARLLRTLHAWLDDGATPPAR